MDMEHEYMMSPKIQIKCFNYISYGIIFGGRIYLVTSFLRESIIYR